MSLRRLIVAAPVLAGLVVTGSAVARMMPVQSVRDTVYGPGAARPACVHNGVHFNKQGHANCGLHKGWTQEGGASDQRGAHAGTTEPAGRTAHGKPTHPAHAAAAHSHGGNGHDATAHGPAAHGGNGHGHGHAGNGHANGHAAHGG